MAISSILLFTDLDVGTFAPGSSSLESVKGHNALPAEEPIGWGGSKEPELIDPEPEFTSDMGSSGGGERLDAEDPLIRSIEKLRIDLEENYKVE